MYKRFVRPRLFKRDPEEIHDRVLHWLHILGRIAPFRECVRTALTVRDPLLEQKLFGLEFRNPVMLAAGMDKNGSALEGFEALGFGSIEMGCVTALRQSGNDKPRLFRLVSDDAIINRMGFNGDGAEAVAYKMDPTRLRIPLGVNIGKSKAVPPDKMDEVIADYSFTLEKLWRYGDFFVINVSSPNTPGLRNLQEPEFLKILLAGIKRQSCKMPLRPGQRPKPLLLKIAPDLTFEELDGILQVIKEVGIDGIVAVNTTTNRNGLKTSGGAEKETGGLSGAPLRRRALEVVTYIHHKNPSLPIIGVGGISSEYDASAMILAGASLIQIYTGLVYEGPGLVRRINRGLLRLFNESDIESVADFNRTVNRS